MGQDRVAQLAWPTLKPREVSNFIYIIASLDRFFNRIWQNFEKKIQKKQAEWVKKSNGIGYYLIIEQENKTPSKI